MEKQHKKTLFACYTSAITQAVALNLLPLLYVIFNTKLNLTLTQIALLPTVIFAIQIFIDLLFTPVTQKIGYKNTAILSDVFCICGFVFIFFSNYTANAFLFILTGTTLLAIGCAIIEIVVSPLASALPVKEKSKTMNILHSFYCWGHLMVILVTTLFLTIFGQKNWAFLPLVWCAIPIVNLLNFLSIDKMITLEDEGRTNDIKGFAKNKKYILFLLTMIFAGACEQCIAQWASYFAEIGLNVSKTSGDLFGTSLFALFMAISRTVFGLVSEKINLNKTLFICALLLIIAYLITSLSPIPIISLIGIGLCGMFVGCFWPGTLCLVQNSDLKGGTLMYALLSMCGDIGCTIGPLLIGKVAELNNITNAITVATIFPISMAIMLLSLILIGRKKVKT